MSATRGAGTAIAVVAAVLLAFGLLAPVARAAVRGDGASTSAANAFQAEGAGGNVSGCSGTAISKDENNAVIDQVTAPGAPAASRSNALKVDYDGVVSYDGQSDNLIKNHHWDISLFGIKVKSGGGTNSEERTHDASDEKVSDYIPIRMSGKYFVSFQINGEGGSCNGSLWVEIDENPVGTVPWLLGTGLMLAGVAGAAFSVPSGAAAAATAAGAATATGAAGTTPAETVIGGEPAAAPPADDGAVIGGDSETGTSPPEPPHDDGPVIGG